MGRTGRMGKMGIKGEGKMEIEKMDLFELDDRIS
jgi:hypothetical protein